MSTGAIIILAVAVAAIIALVLARPALQSGGGGLRRRFGPEYDRVVQRHGGDTKAAQRELSERVRRYGDLSVRQLDETVREQYVARWAGIQERFVDAPGQAVAEAADLLDQLAVDRGYPADGPEQRAEALSVRHPERVEGYRQLHAVAVDARQDRGGTEELRRALVGARELFEHLVRSQPHDRGARRRPLARTRLTKGQPHGATATAPVAGSDGEAARAHGTRV